ncbi:hypothetical protein HG531_010388 [Fusarium graminearum]|nr:hypothetical protein HG531_010388 [Fusarium graminearum]
MSFSSSHSMPHSVLPQHPCTNQSDNQPTRLVWGSVVGAVFAVLLCQLLKTSPGALLDHLLAPTQSSGDLLESLSTIFGCCSPLQVELEEGSKEESSGPDPLRSLVVVTALACCEVITIFTVDVSLICNTQSMHCVIRVKEGRCGGHGDSKVGTQLVILVLLARLVQIFVDSTTVDDRSVDIVLGIIFSRDGNIVASLEVGLEKTGPVSERDRATIRFLYTRVRIFAFSVESSKPVQSAVQHTGDLNGSAIARSTGDTLGACPLAFAHLVHPGTAVVLVATEDDTIVPVNMNILVEAFILHLGINLGTSIGLPVLHSGSMSLERFLDHLLNSALLGSPFTIAKILTQWMSQVVFLDDVFENAPPSLETSIDKLSMSRNIVNTVSAIALVSFLSFASVHEEIEIRQAEFTPRRLGSRGDIVV